MGNPSENKMLSRTALVGALTGFATCAAADANAVIDVPQQRLIAAIEELSQETGKPIAANLDALGQRTSQAVQGPITVKAALEQMIDDPNLSVVELPDGSLAVTRQNFVAQNADDEVIQLEAIVVRGELIERTLQDSQTSTAVTTGENIEQRADPNFESILERTAGVSVTGAGDVAIRGVSQTGVGGAGTGSTISVSVDGAVLSDFGLLSREDPIPTWDLEQVEVLRGPQSTQSGRNALAGAIVVRSKDPFFGEEFKLRGEVGQHGARRGAFAYNIGNDDETVALRLSVDAQNSDGNIENSLTGEDNLGYTRARTYRLGALWQPTDRFQTVVKIARREDSRGAQLVDVDRFPPDRFNDSNVREFADTTIDTLNVRATYDISSAWQLDWESTFLDGSILEQEDDDHGPTDTGFLVRDRDQTSQQHEVKLFYNTDRTKAVMGLLYAQYETDQTLSGTQPLSNFSPLLPVGTVTFDQTRNPDTTNLAAFGEIEHDLTANVTLIGGFRYDYEDFSDEFRTIASTSVPVPIPLPPQTVVELSDSYNAFLPKLGIVYNFDQLQSLGFVVQRGYRAGGATNFPTTGAQFFDPEFTTNYELAYRYQTADGSLTFNANGFYTRWTDQQVIVGPSTVAQFTANAGESENYGLEADVSWLPTANLNLYASGAYVKTKYLDFVNAGVDLSGNEFPDAPAFTAAIGGTYFFNNDVYVGGDISYTGSSFANSENTLKNDARLLVNARVGYQQDRWEAFLYANNLLDEEYIFGSRVSSTGTFGFAGAPRTIGAVVQARF